MLTNSSVDAGGELVLVCEEVSFIPKLKMRFKNIEDALAFYKRYANCVSLVFGSLPPQRISRRKFRRSLFV